MVIVLLNDDIVVVSYPKGLLSPGSVDVARLLLARHLRKTNITIASAYDKLVRAMKDYHST
jgi:hypothetical protein